MDDYREASGWVGTIDGLDIQLWSNFLNRFDFVCVMGLPGVGKTELINMFKVNDRYTLTKWSKTDIYNMIFNNDTRQYDFSYRSIIDSFEENTLLKLKIKPFHKVIYEGYLLTPQNRRRIANMFAGKRKLLIVLDAPKKLVFRRFFDSKVNDRKHPEEELLKFKNMSMSIKWPKFNEGWDCIVYQDVFEGQCVEYFKDTIDAKRII